MENPSPFVKSIKPWLIRKVLSDYLRARNMFSNLDRNRNNGHQITFEDLRKLSELLFTIKENLHLVFKRVVDPKNKIYEEAEKYMPDEYETEFINNVGLLFHKAMVVRELEYVKEHYSVDSEDFYESEESFKVYWRKMSNLFDEGIELIKLMLKNCKDNVIVLSYLVENERYVKESFGENVKKLLARIFGEKKIDAAYLYVAEYFIESGWKDRAKKVLSEALKINPNNKEAGRLLAYIS